MTIATVKLSKTLAYILRHNPSLIGVSLDGNGFVNIDVLAEKLSEHFGQVITRHNILHVVEIDSKQRFTVNSGNIRAAQGHSFAVNLELTALKPPTVLYHGTVGSAVENIKQLGLLSGSREFVHLSESLSTAIQVGSRRGTPMILVIQALEAHNNGTVFFKSENNVWLTSTVPPRFIKELTE